MTPKPPLNVYFWKENQLIGNLGDAIVPILIEALGYKLIPSTNTSAPTRNQGRCLLVIGSLLNSGDLGPFKTPLDVWGCGWKGLCPAPAILAQLRVYAVRGPHTVTGLGLPAATPVGDPALLLPNLMPRHIEPHGRTVVVPHLHRTRLMPARLRCQLTGCDEALSTQVLQRQGIKYPGWQRQMLALGKTWLRFGLRPATVWGTVKRLAGAAFVLTGSLHGAILAQAYGVPWAAYADGYVDAPPKWHDWAAYLGIRIQFVTNLAEGQQWWQAEGRGGVVRDLQPLLDAFPYPLPLPLREKATHAANT